LEPGEKRSKRTGNQAGWEDRTVSSVGSIQATEGGKETVKINQTSQRNLGVARMGGGSPERINVCAEKVQGSRVNGRPDDRNARPPGEHGLGVR